MNSIIVILITSSLILTACNHSSTNSNSATMESKNAQETTYPVKYISISIDKPAEEVYLFASNPENFPKWIAFIKSMTRQGDIWIGKTDIGDIKIKFAPHNDFGIIDHWVTLTNGETVYNPMRVVANNKGCEFSFMLFRMPGRTENEFNEDSNAVTADLQTLKKILEK